MQLPWSLADRGILGITLASQPARIVWVVQVERAMCAEPRQICNDNRKVYDGSPAIGQEQHAANASAGTCGPPARMLQILFIFASQ